MPDDYERALGWNPAIPDHNEPVVMTNGPTFFPDGTPAGYTRLEEYLHFCAVPHGYASRPVSIDLRRYTAGFDRSLRFTVGPATGGTVRLDPAREGFADFVPATGHVGRARFEFTVRDGEGDAWTQTVSLVVLPAHPARP
jgi:hypothetical protein